MANEEKWGVWCVGPEWPNGAWVDVIVGGGTSLGATNSDAHEAASGYRGLNPEYDYQVRPYPSHDQPPAAACPDCRAAVCDCNDPKAEWGFWWKAPMDAYRFCSSKVEWNIMTSIASRGEAIAELQKSHLRCRSAAGWLLGPVQRRRDPPWRCEEAAETALQAKIDDIAEQIDVARLALPVSPIDIDTLAIDTLARALHATDPRVTAFVTRRGDGITAEKVYAVNEGGWAAEWRERAERVTVWMKGGAQ